MPSLPTGLRFEPLDPRRVAVDPSPFRARGLAFVTALRYVDTRLAGGREAFRAEIGAADAFAGFYDQLFVVGADYDAAPLLRLFTAVARLEGVSVARLIEERSRRSALEDTQGMWRPLYKSASADAIAERLPVAFNRYFQPSRARTVAVAPGRLECELAAMPAPMSGLYVCSTAGWVPAALEQAGAREPRLQWGALEPDGELAGVPLVRARFVASWSASVPA